MLFAHWLYLIAVVLDMFADEPSNEKDNVHKRVDSSLEMIDSTHLSTKAPSNPSNPLSIRFTHTGSKCSRRFVGKHEAWLFTGRPDATRLYNQKLEPTRIGYSFAETIQPEG
jgi:hypothetical protein